MTVSAKSKLSPRIYCKMPMPPISWLLFSNSNFSLFDQTKKKFLEQYSTNVISYWVMLGSNIGESTRLRMVPIQNNNLHTDAVLAKYPLMFKLDQRFCVSI